MVLSIAFVPVNKVIAAFEMLQELDTDGSFSKLMTDEGPCIVKLGLKFQEELKSVGLKDKELRICWER